MSSLAVGRPAPHPSGPRGDHSFRLGVEEEGSTLHLRLAGAFEWVCVGWVEAALGRVSEASVERVVFDLRGLSFLDIAGLRTLLRASERARADHFEMIVVRPSGLVNRIFTLTSAGEELTMVDCLPGENGAG